MNTFTILLFFLLMTVLSKQQKQTFTSWLRRVWIPAQNVKETLDYWNVRRGERRKFLHCPAELYSLVSDYFAPIKRVYLNHELLMEGIELGRIIDGNKGKILVQVKGRKIYFLNLGETKSLEKFQQQRLDFFMELLQSYLEECKNKHFCHKDFEFILDLKDCHSGWTMMKGNNIEIIKKYAKLPILAMTTCKGRSAIPVVQWYSDRDGQFERWDEHRLTFLEHVEHVPQWKRQRGAFRPYSSWNEQGSPIPTLINETNWHLLGRSKLQFMGWHRPDLVNVGIQVAPEDRKIFDQYSHRLPRKMYLSMLEQAQKYHFIIHSEGWCGWADRLKLLLHSNSTIFMQSTPCSEYYQRLFKPWIHYIPVDGLFRRLEKRISWARSHPRGAARIAKNSLQQAQKYLSEYSMKCYQYLIFAQYSILFSANVTSINGTQSWNKEF